MNCFISTLRDFCNGAENEVGDRVVFLHRRQDSSDWLINSSLTFGWLKKSSRMLSVFAIEHHKGVNHVFEGEQWLIKSDEGRATEACHNRPFGGASRLTIDCLSSSSPAPLTASRNVRLESHFSACTKKATQPIIECHCWCDINNLNDEFYDARKEIFRVCARFNCPPVHFVW